MSKLITLAKYLKVDVNDVFQNDDDDTCFTYYPDIYMLLTSEEVDNIAELEFKDHLYEITTFEIPAFILPYFNEDEYKKDNLSDSFEWMPYQYLYEICDEENKDVYYVFKVY